MIEIPDHDWVGDKKKVELRNEEVIQDIFKLATLMRTDFTAALNRVLTTSTKRVILEEQAMRQRLSTPFYPHQVPPSIATSDAPPPLASPERAPQTQKTSSPLNGASLI